MREGLFRTTHLGKGCKHIALIPFTIKLVWLYLCAHTSKIEHTAAG